MTMHSIQSSLQLINNRISQACQKAGRDTNTVTLLAVSKFQSVDSIREAYRCGQRDFGENYVQELIEKQNQLTDLPDIRWHFIGHLQRNKTKLLRNCFAIHSVDSLELAKKLVDTHTNRDLPLRVYVQLEVDALDTNKFGLTEAEAALVTDFLARQNTLDWIGFMGIGPNSNDPVHLLSLYQTFFTRGHALWNQVSHSNQSTPRFSLGMSGDLEVAIAAGTHCIRVGTAIFGERSPKR